MSEMEERFINNLNERELRRSGRNNNVVANLHLAFMTVGYNCPFVGERLQDSGIRSHYGANIASLQRGSTIIPVPAGDTRIFPGDILGVIGTDEEIQAMLPEVESNPESESSPIQASDIKLSSIKLSESSPLVGMTVAESQLGSRYGLLLVSIDRNGNFFTPEGFTRFQEGDALWIVGNQEIFSKIK